MAERFELRTRHQFAGLIERRNRWLLLKNEPTARSRFEQLVGPEWARQSHALEAGSEEALWLAEPLDPMRARQVQSHVAAADTLLRFAREKEFLCTDDLLALHGILLSGIHAAPKGFRKGDAKPLAPGHEPTDPELIAPVIDNALGWFRSDSFAEMHEVEKTALMLIKLADVQPFEEANGRALRLFSNFFLLKAGYSPAVIPANQASQYALAIQRALGFDTQPIIDLIASATERSLRWCLDEPPPPPKLNVLAG
ncbi:MAG: Fic family protein [Acidimicrobiia bacterium]|nr:Fic family protein [Acidimicrobiia bacterium]